MPRSVIGVLEHPVRALFLLANVLFGALMLLLVVGTVLSIAFAIIGGVGRAVFGHDDASPTAVVVVPPSAPPIEDVTDTVTAGARPIVSDRPELSDDRQLITVPAFPAIAFLCGVGEGSRVDIVPCGHRPRGTVRVRGPRGSARCRHGLREGMGRLLARPSVLGVLGAVRGSSRGRAMGALGEPVVRARRGRRSDP